MSQSNNSTFHFLPVGRRLQIKLWRPKREYYRENFTIDLLASFKKNDWFERLYRDTLAKFFYASESEIRDFFENTCDDLQQQKMMYMVLGDSVIIDSTPGHSDLYSIYLGDLLDLCSTPEISSRFEMAKFKLATPTLKKYARGSELNLIERMIVNHFKKSAVNVLIYNFKTEILKFFTGFSRSIHDRTLNSYPKLAGLPIEEAYFRHFIKLDAKVSKGFISEYRVSEIPRLIEGERNPFLAETLEAIELGKESDVYLFLLNELLKETQGEGL